MKDYKNNLTTLLIVFIILKLVDFNNLGILDYLLFALLAVDVIVAIFSWRKGK